MSYSCMAGRCGTCRCKVVDGEVLDGGQEQQRPLEAGDAYVLACQTYLTEPCTIEIPEPDEVVVHPARIVKATVTSIEDMTHDIKRLLSSPPSRWSSRPGSTSSCSSRPSMCGLIRWRVCAATGSSSSTFASCRTAV